MSTPAFAVIDLGSNTFHLLVVDAGDRSTLYRQRVFVSLAEEGIDRIGPSAYVRGVSTMERFAQILTAYEVKVLRAVGTAALRSAVNAEHFIEEVYQKTGIKIEVIDGIQEATLIFKGISTAVDMQVGSHLIMDIGGGSVEYIQVSAGTIRSVGSYNIGLGELHNRYAHQHPITVGELASIREFTRTSIKEVVASQQGMQSDQLIGASGSFEVLAALCGMPVSDNSAVVIDTAKARLQINAIYNMSLSEIVDHDAIPASRAQLIVLAMILIEQALDISGAKRICISPVAMKEGILAGMSLEV